MILISSSARARRYTGKETNVGAKPLVSSEAERADCKFVGTVKVIKLRSTRRRSGALLASSASSEGLPYPPVHAGGLYLSERIHHPLYGGVLAVLDLDPVTASAGLIYYGRSRRFDTNPSRPMLQAARNRSGPISPRSNGLIKMPSGRRANL